MSIIGQPQFPAGTSFRTYTMTVTDALDSIPIPRNTLFVIIFPRAGSVGVNVHGVSNVENTSRAAEAGHTNGSFIVAAGAESMPIPVKGWGFLLLDGIASTCVIDYVLIKGNNDT